MQKRDGSATPSATVFTLSGNSNNGTTAHRSSNFDGLKTPGFTKTGFDFGEHVSLDDMSDDGLDKLSDGSEMMGCEDDDVSSIHSYGEYRQR